MACVKPERQEKTWSYLGNSMYFCFVLFPPSCTFQSTLHSRLDCLLGPKFKLPLTSMTLFTLFSPSWEPLSSFIKCTSSPHPLWPSMNTKTSMIFHNYLLSSPLGSNSLFGILIALYLYLSYGILMKLPSYSSKHPWDQNHLCIRIHQVSSPAPNMEPALSWPLINAGFLRGQPQDQQHQHFWELVSNLNTPAPPQIYWLIQKLRREGQRSVL